MINPKTIPIQGDLSRADAEVLLELCQDKDVVEFGMGGSTLLIARVAKSLHSWDTDSEWLNRTKSRCDRLAAEFSCQPVLELTSDVPVDIPDCDVLFIDGRGDDRFKWLRFFPKCRVMVCHDSLGDTGGNGPTLYHIMAGLFKEQSNVEYLDRASFHHKDSNMVIIYRRAKPLKFVNWNVVETENRLDPYAPV